MPLPDCASSIRHIILSNLFQTDVRCIRSVIVTELATRMIRSLQKTNSLREMSGVRNEALSQGNLFDSIISCTQRRQSCMHILLYSAKRAIHTLVL